MGQKQDGEKEKRKRERPNVGNNNGQLRIAKATSGGARNPPGPIASYCLCGRNVRDELFCTRAC